MATKCAYHPNRDAVGSCVSCGRLVCAECKAVLGGKIYCNPCADKMLVGKTETVVVGGEEQQATKVVKDMVAEKLAEGKNAKKIVEELVKGGWSQESATQFVTTTEQQFKQSPEGRQILASKYKRRMLYGVLWLIGGAILTGVTQGNFIFFGAIIWGLIDFFRGFFGWLKYR